MRMLDEETFSRLIAAAPMRPRLKRELRFVASTQTMSIEEWQETELLPITDRSGVRGVLLMATAGGLYLAPYQLSKITASRQTGRAQPIICDFCRTWQAGGNAATISFQKDTFSINSTSFLCCADLACSKHVRNLTPAARLSRAQLREDLSTAQRIARLKKQLQKIAQDLALQPSGL